jgi:hypothetical protein
MSMARDERRRIAPPLTSWDSLRAGLQDEGLFHTAPVRRSPLRAWTLRVASVVILLASGTVVGRLSAGLPLSQAVAFGSPLAAPADSVQGGFTLAANTGQLNSPQAALEQLERAQRAYEEAAAYLAAHDTASSAGSSDQYRTRLAALDMASETFVQALTEAPEDPIINQYYMATMNAREVAIRRLGTTLPATLRMGRF